MCFTAGISGAFALGAWTTAAVLVWARRSRKYVMLPLFFAVMESIQFLQHGVLNECGSKLNQLLTLAGYAHICFQPLVFNEFMWGTPQPPFYKPRISAHADAVLHHATRRLSLVSAAMMLLKAAPAFGQLLGVQGALGWAGEASCMASPEMLCDRRLCAFSGKYHLGWSLPMLKHGYYIPSAVFLHFFTFFVPTLALGTGLQRMACCVCMLSGPFVSDWITRGDADARQFEWPSIWCFFSLSQVLLLLVLELTVTRLRYGRASLPSAADDAQTTSLVAPAAVQQARHEAPAAPADACEPHEAAACASELEPEYAAAEPEAEAEPIAQVILRQRKGSGGRAAKAGSPAPATPRRSSRLQV